MKSLRKLRYLVHIGIRRRHLFVNSALVGLLAETSRLTSCTLEPENAHAALAPFEEHQGEDDSQPIEYIGQHRAKRCAVCPSSEGAKDQPAIAILVIGGVATVEVPDAASYIERARAIPTSVVDVCTEKVVECILLIGSHGPAEQTGANKQEEVGYHDEENRNCGSTGECVEHEAADEAADNTDDGGDGDGAC